jgi:myo-inositol-1-phosphate synthase
LEQASRLIEAIESFRAQRGLRGVVVVNVSSTEPQPAGHPAFGSLDALRSAMASESPVLPVSALYAFSALSAKCAYLDFTPSGAMQIPALQQLASVNGVPYAGNDGKTGETLVKSALAPMFTHRALKVRSWSGTNLLGGGDGATLADPDAAASKTASKARSLASILGYATEGQVHIDNVAELGDWKTAWNHISFEGFLGVRMTMQFTWQGCDSALAAPLVLDLVRLLGRALGLGASGPQPQFGFFFKDPVGCEDHRLVAQYEELIAWVEAASRAPAVPDSAGAA